MNRVWLAKQNSMRMRGKEEEEKGGANGDLQKQFCIYYNRFGLCVRVCAHVCVWNCFMMMCVCVDRSMQQR